MSPTSPFINPNFEAELVQLQVPVELVDEAIRDMAPYKRHGDRALHGDYGHAARAADIFRLAEAG